MKIAIVSKNFLTVTPHAGRAQRFLVFEAQPGKTPRQVERLDLSLDQTLQFFKGDQSHPLASVHALITGSAGSGVIERLKSCGIDTVTTRETDPIRAIQLYLAGLLKATPCDPQELPAPCS